MTDTQNYLQGTIARYLKELSERRIVPGGGSVSALTAAMGAGLNLMVINYSIGKSDPEGVTKQLFDDKKRQQEAMENFSLFIDEDCAAFSELMGALSSGLDAQKEYMAAAMVPIKICRECHRSMDITAHLLENANRNLATDVGCAAHMLRSAFYSAQLNVEVNLKKIGDREFVEQAGEELRAMRSNIDRLSGEIILQVDDILNSAK